MKERLTAQKVTHLVLVLAVLVALVSYRTWFAADNSQNSEPKKDQICDLSHSSCDLLIGEKSMAIAISQLPVRAERDFIIRLEGGDPEIKPIKAWLEGRDMFMGTIPVNFESSGNGWQANALVGSCTSPMMVWLLNIEWSNGQRQQLALSVARE
ncbi:hypothetical protein PEKONANI_02545 [Aeromonas jandaei]|uniref:hypothetical protein n=1 Tax=Aeromonas jandaei TaxID=650 RepID=UPI00366D7D71